MGLLELPDLRHTLVDIGTTLLCISGYNGLPGRTLPINLIHETARRSERVDNAALSSAVSYEIPSQMIERALFCGMVLGFFILLVLSFPIKFENSCNIHCFVATRIFGRFVG